MIVRRGEARWEGGFKRGKGVMRTGSGSFEGTYSVGSRFEQLPGTNPEEMLGAAHAGCFSMALALVLEEAGFKVEEINTSAKVSMDKVGEGYKITSVELNTEGLVAGIDERTFLEKVEVAKKSCPVSVALASVPIKVGGAKLLKRAA
jgi:osmotically inducible protein OsmC